MSKEFLFIWLLYLCMYIFDVVSSKEKYIHDVLSAQHYSKGYSTKRINFFENMIVYKVYNYYISSYNRM